MRLLDAVSNVEGVVSAEVTCVDLGLTDASQRWKLYIDASDDDQAAVIIRNFLTALAEDPDVLSDWYTPGWYNTHERPFPDDRFYPDVADPDLDSWYKVEKIRDLWGITP